MEDTISLKKIIKLLIMSLVLTILICYCTGTFTSKEEREFTNVVNDISNDVISICKDNALKGKPHISNYYLKDNKLMYEDKSVNTYNDMNGNINLDNNCDITFNIYNDKYKAIKGVDRVSIKKRKSNVCKYDSLDIGSLVECGKEEFYVLSTTDTTIKLMSKYNINISTMKQDNENINNIAFDLINNRNNANNTYCKRTLYGCNLYSKVNNNFINGDNEGTILEDSTIKGYVDRYGILLNLENLIDISLIAKEELDLLGCESTNNTCVNSEYKFLYETSYWTKSYYKGSPSLVWRISKDGYLGTLYAYYDNYAGIRPVIEVKK